MSMNKNTKKRIIPNTKISKSNNVHENPCANIKINNIFDKMKQNNYNRIQL